MNTYLHIAALLLSSLITTAGFAAETPLNTLMPAEKEQGWILLFDGTTNGWRGFQKTTFPAKGWGVEDGCLTCLAKKGGDIITKETFADFELTWEWRLPPKGNSGIKYFVDEKRTDLKGKRFNRAIAHEYQMIDDEGYVKKPIDLQKTGAWYEIIAPSGAKPAPLGEFNQSRLVVRGQQVEHWLNGVKVVAYAIGDVKDAARIAVSPFKTAKGYADKIVTPILLQDHDTRVWYRNIKLRKLTAP